MSDRPPADADPLDAAPPANGSPAAALVPPETLDPAAPPPPDSPPSPPSGPPTPPAPLEPSGFSLRAVGLGLLLLCPWVLLVNGMYMSSAFRLQQLVLLMSFGALLTFFLLKYIFDFLPAAWQLRPPEIAVLYTMLLIGIPSAMLGRLALESAAVAHMADVDSDLAGRKGFVPPNWAPQGHVRMVTHRTPMDPLDWPHAGAPTSSPPPPPASFVVTANQAALRTQAIYTDVLLKYVFAENPNLAAQWQTLQASESPALRAAADRFGAPDGLPYLLWREAAAAPSSPAPPAPPAPAAPAPALAPGKPATPGKSPTPTVT
ncbi:MAG: hypothetical protein ACREJ2_06750, partial [Planctomycetota bacterium]